MEHLLDRAVQITRPLRVEDGQGGWKAEPFVVPGCQGRVRPLTTREARFETKTTHVIYLPAGTDIRAGDIAMIDNVEYEVIGVRYVSVTWHHIEVDVKSKQVKM